HRRPGQRFGTGVAGGASDEQGDEEENGPHACCSRSGREGQDTTGPTAIARVSHRSLSCRRQTMDTQALEARLREANKLEALAQPGLKGLSVHGLSPTRKAPMRDPGN